MSASALSLKAGVSRRAAGQVETGQWMPRLPTVELLADALELSPAWMAFGMDLPWEAREGGELRCAGMAQRTREAREALGLSLREVAKRLGRFASAVRAIESGTMPAVDTVEELAKVLSVSPAWLAYGIGEREVLVRRSRTSPLTAQGVGE